MHRYTMLDDLANTTFSVELGLTEKQAIDLYRRQLDNREWKRKITVEMSLADANDDFSWAAFFHERDIYTAKDELDAALVTLCEADNIDIDRSRRIWRCSLMEACPADLEPGPVYGLLRLTGFWSALGWPADAPAPMQRGANVPAAEYHSDAYYRKVLREHRAWLERKSASWCP